MDIDAISVRYECQGHRSKVKVAMSKNVIFMHFALLYLTCDLEVKVSRVKVKGHMGQGQMRVPNKLLHFIKGIV